MRISDWSSDVCSSDLASAALHVNNIAHERDLARIEAAKARKVTGLLVSMLESADPAQARGEEVSEREVLDQASGRIHADLPDQPDVRAKIAAIIGLVTTTQTQSDEGENFRAQEQKLNTTQLGKPH